MWLVIEYAPTSLFSLKSSQSTSSGAKSLFVPSPYAVKMALLNAIITYGSLDLGRENFELIRDLKMSFMLPNSLVVNNCMIRIAKLKHSSSYSPDNPFQSTVAFREYVYLHNNIKIAINIKHFNIDEINFLKKWFMHINYFGKKGCFFQFVSSTILDNIDDDNYSIEFNGKLTPGILSKMDDIDPKATFENVDNYNNKKAMRKNKVYNIPIREIKSSKEYHVYEKIK